MSCNCGINKLNCKIDPKYNVCNCYVHTKHYSGIISSCPLRKNSQITSNFTKGSIDLTYNDSTGSPLASTTLIPGKLDTNLLENGDYVNDTIIKAFELLKTIGYDNSIIDNSIIEYIKYDLTAFKVAIILEQRITEYTTNLAQEVFAGTLSIDDFNQRVETETKNLADKVPDNYSFILNKVQEAIDHNLHILTNKPETPCGCDKPDKEPCGCKH